MQPFGKSQPIRRVEDTRFLTGQGHYVDDIAPREALHGFVLRSPVAHGTITALDVSAARDVAALVLTADDLAQAGVTAGLPATTVENLDGTQGASPRRPLLAEGRVRYVGEPVAFVVADSLEAAKDAAELIELEIDDLPAAMERAPGEQLHADVPDNLAFHWGLGDRDGTEAAIAEAAHVVTMEIANDRVIINPMETRGAYAEMVDGRLHLCTNSQGVWGPKQVVADLLGLAPEDVHVTTSDVGGGFGMKAMPHPDMVLVAQACRMLDKPVRWIAERSEAMQGDAAGRDLVTRATLAFDAEHRITGYKVENTVNLGAYNSNFGQLMQGFLFSRVFTGTYDISTAWIETWGYYTNTTPTDAYRGAGRPEANYALERMMDRAARDLGVSPWELRDKNFIRSFPHTTVADETYDVGDFPRLLAHVQQAADVDGFAARRKDSAQQGKLRGLGICYYIESILGDPSETARVEMSPEGARIFVGTQSNGQGHETVYAKFLSDQTGIPMERIEVVQGDSDLIPTGGGTGGSRSVTVQASATLATVKVMVEGFSLFLAEREGVDPSAVSFDDERFRIDGSNTSPTMLEAAALAQEAGREDLLTVEQTATLPARSFPNGAHVAEVEIDEATGQTQVVGYTVVDDFGNLINPLLAEGQVHGGVAQGLGQALCERAVYDEDGQLLSASFMDYAMPRADDMPWVSFTSDPVPSTANLLGMKGCGEAGTVGALAAVTNAAQDALWDRGVRRVDMPLTPQRVWEMLQKAKSDV